MKKDTINDIGINNNKKKTLENTAGTIKNGESREAVNIVYTRRRKTKQKHNTICVGHHSAQTKHK